MSPDPRLTLARNGLAARALEGVLPAETFTDPTQARCIAPFVPILRAPHGEAETDDQLLFGETFEVLAHEGPFALGQARRDGYVGYVERTALSDFGPPPTHRVAALRAYAFAAPNFKSAPTGLYSLNSLLHIDGEDGRWRHAAGAGWLAVEQLSPIGVFESDPATVIERFTGAPYLWGGRTSLGLDCSGLTQQAFYACGRACPRDSDMQRGVFPAIDRAEALRGDLVFWPDHVGMLLDASRVIHANARTMDVAIESLEAVISLRAEQGPPTFGRGS